MDEKQRRERKWRLSQALPFAFPVIIALILVFLVSISPRFSAYSPPAAKEVTEILTGLGYAPYERTESLCNELGIKSGGKTTVSAESGLLEIDFLQMNGTKSMITAREILCHYIESQGWGYCKTNQKGCCIMSCTSGGKHIFFVQARNTILLIHYEDAAIAQATELLDSLGYPGAEYLQ